MAFVGLKICPTRVGMNRGWSRRMPDLAFHLPHTRGDEPGNLCRQPPLRLIICPTRVGMNRTAAKRSMITASNLPHTRGDEPGLSPRGRG